LTTHGFIMTMNRINTHTQLHADVLILSKDFVGQLSKTTYNLFKL